MKIKMVWFTKRGSIFLTKVKQDHIYIYIISYIFELAKQTINKNGIRFYEVLIL
jgi:hypothetical protein